MHKIVSKVFGKMGNSFLICYAIIDRVPSDIHCSFQPTHLVVLNYQAQYGAPSPPGRGVPFFWWGGCGPTAWAGQVKPYGQGMPCPYVKTLNIKYLEKNIQTRVCPNHSTDD
jgi:hypothetical protein